VSAGAQDWPQANSNWCAVASIEAVANYTFQLQGGQSSFPFHVGGQQQIAADLNSPAAVSQWGTPSWNGVGPGFAADIARDFGTDPRSIAWGILRESAASSPPPVYQPGNRNPRIARQGYTYHNVIYHQAANQANFALAGVARTLVRFGQPIIMTTACIPSWSQACGRRAILSPDTLRTSTQSTCGILGWAAQVVAISRRVS